MRISLSVSMKGSDALKERLEGVLLKNPKFNMELINIVAKTLAIALKITEEDNFEVDKFQFSLGHNEEPK